MKRLRERMQSDTAASNTVENIIIIALAVFAALALFTYILSPARDGAEQVGDKIGNTIGDLLDGKDVNPDGMNP
jgi:hypothetical protein